MIDIAGSRRWLPAIITCKVRSSGAAPTDQDGPSDLSNGLHRRAPAAFGDRGIS